MPTTSHLAEDGAWETSGYPSGLDIYREDVWPLLRHRGPGATVTREEHADVPAAVYFVLGGDLLKIGLSINPEKRLRALRSASPLELTMHRLVACSRAESRIIERELHRQFGAFRHHDEWFDAAPVMSVIERLSDREICALCHLRPATEQERAEIERETWEGREAYKRQQREETARCSGRCH